MNRGDKLIGTPGAVIRSISNIVFPYAQPFALVMAFGLPWSHAFFYIGFAGLLLCVILSVNRYGELIRTLKLPVVFWALILFLWIVVGITYTAAPIDMAVFDLKKYRKILLLPLLVLVFKDLSAGRRLILAYAAGVMVLLTFTLIDGFQINKFFNFDISRFKDQSYNPSSLVYWRNHIVHGFHVTILFVISVIAGVQSKKFRWPCFTIGLLCVYDLLFFIHGRAALLGLLASIFLLAYYYSKSTKLFTIGTIVVLMCAGTSILLSTKVEQRVMSVVSEASNYYAKNNVYTSGGNRLYFWSKSVELFQSAPIIGTGPGSFRSRMLQPDILIPNFSYHHAHNEYLTLLSQHGLIGFLLFSFFIVSIYTSAKSHPNQQLGRIVIIGLAVFLVNAFTDSSLHNESEGWTLLLMACVANTCRTSRRNANLRKQGSFMRWATSLSLKILKQPLSKSVGAVRPLDYVVETGALPIVRRSIQRKAIFWSSMQAGLKANVIDPNWKKGIFLYFGENQIGDAMMDLAPRSLLVQHGLSVDLLTTPKIADLFIKDPWFALVASSHLLLSQGKYDFAIVLNNKRRPLASKIKYFKDLPWVSIHENYFGPDFHRSGFAARRFADLLGIELSTSQFNDASAQKLGKPSLPKATLTTTGDFTVKPIAICVGGVDASRTYFRWADVIKLILLDENYRFVLLGSTNGVGCAAELMSKFSQQAAIDNLVGQTTLLQAHGVMADCSLVVCADGGLMHVAASINTPLVALFSNAIRPEWRLYPGKVGESISSLTLDVNDIAPELIAAAIKRQIRIAGNNATLST